MSATSSAPVPAGAAPNSTPASSNSASRKQRRNRPQTPSLTKPKHWYGYPKDQAERAQLAERIAAAETRHHELRQTAAAKDQEAARRMALQAAAQPDQRHMDLLDAEVRTRAELSPHRQHQENLGREAQMSATISPTGAARTPELGLPGLHVQPVPIEPPLAVPPPQPSL